MNRAALNTPHSVRTRAVPASVAAMFVLFQAPLFHGQSVDYGALEQLFKEPVTTSVNGSPQRVSDVPATMEIITAEDIRRSGAKDIPGVLRHVGGIDTLEWGNDNIDVSVRGYDQAYSSRLLVLLDGRQVYADDYGYIPWSSVPVELSAIRQIEIIKGPNSALFGFNAAGGVINIITYNPLYDRVNTVEVTGGTQSLAGGSVVATHKFGERAGVLLSAGGSADSDFSTPIPVFSELEPRKHEYRAVFGVDSIIRLGEKMQLGLDASHSIVQQNEINPAYQFNDLHYDISSVKGVLTAENRIGLLKATIYTNWMRITSTPGTGDQAAHPKNRVTVVQLEDVFAAGLHHILHVAGEYRHNTENITPSTEGSIHYDVFAVSTMWDWKIAPVLTLTNALRIDHLALGRDGLLPPDYPFSLTDWDRSITQPSFNTGLVWKASDKDSLRLTISRGAVIPSLVLSGAFQVDTPNLKISGSPFLKPSVVTNYEIGWDHAIGSRHILFRGSAFDQDSIDLLSVSGGSVGTPGAPYFVPANVGSSDATGLELGFRSAHLKNYRWSVDYRPEWITDHLVPSAQNGVAYVDYQHTTPVHLLKANLGWANKRWELDGYLLYQSQMQGFRQSPTIPFLTPVGGFVSLDGRVAYNVANRIAWSVSGQNLTHATQVQTAGPAVERRVLGEMSFHF